MSCHAKAVVICATAALAHQAFAAPRLAEDEERRVELVKHMERSAVLVLALSHQERPTGEAESRAKLAIGSGVIVRADGLVVSAAHVVAGADWVAVKMGPRDRDPMAAAVVFLDLATDLALLRISDPPVGLVAARLGDSDRVRKGETVYVFGNPMGLERSLSVGVISGRHVLPHVAGGTVEAEVIQTDAAVNPGNSGGPIFDSRGEVIAIAQLIASRSGGSEGLGFGLAVNAVKKILALDPCTWLGFSGVVLTEDLAAALNVPRSGGVLVQHVTPGGPASDAGLREGTLPVQFGEAVLLLGGDVVLEANHTPFMEWVRTLKTGGSPGERHEYRLLVLRGGRLVEVPVVAVHRSAW